MVEEGCWRHGDEVLVLGIGAACKIYPRWGGNGERIYGDVREIWEETREGIKGLDQ